MELNGRGGGGRVRGKLRTADARIPRRYWQEEAAQVLPFSYTVKRNKTGAYSGELLISRKEGSKTLTRSSVLLAFHIILDDWYAGDGDASERDSELGTPLFYKGPKAIGQIFGISYLYSVFWNLGLIRVPVKVAEKMRP